MSTQRNGDPTQADQWKSGFADDVWLQQGGTLMMKKNGNLIDQHFLVAGSTNSVQLIVKPESVLVFKDQWRLEEIKIICLQKYKNICHRETQSVCEQEVWIAVRKRATILIWERVLKTAKAQEEDGGGRGGGFAAEQTASRKKNWPTERVSVREAQWLVGNL